MKNFLIKFKKTKLWFFFLFFIFKPLFNFIWKNLINLKGRLIYLRFKKKYKLNKNENYLSNDKDKKIIRNSEIFKNLANKINQNLDDKFLENIRNKIGQREYDNNAYDYFYFSD